MPLRRALRLCLLAGRGVLVAHVLLVLAQGLVPVAGLWAMRWLVDAVATGALRGDVAAAFPAVLAAVAVAASVALVGLLLRGVAGHVAERHGRTLTDRCIDQLHRHAATLDLGQLEDPRYHDLLHRAGQEATQRPARFVQNLAGLGVAAVTLLAMGGALATVEPLLPLLVAVLAVPAVLVRLKHARLQLQWQEQNATLQRETIYLGGLLTGRAAAKELRVFGQGSWFGDWLTRVRDGLRRSSLRLSVARARADVLAQSLASVAVFGAYLYLGRLALRGVLSIGGLVMHAQAVQRAQNGVRDLLGALAGLSEDRLFLQQFFSFLDQRPRIVAPATPMAVPRTRATLSCEGVSFTYPGSAAPALRGVDLELRPGEHVALVGRNGSGKSTLVRLLARLHDPDAGSVRFGGIDLRSFDPAAWRQRIAVLFQDALPLEFAARLNIQAGQPERHDDAALYEAARRAGVHERLATLPLGYDTQLGRRLGPGAELSAGEWRKLLLARALYRDAEILILDEPSAFLDPQAEQELMAHLRTDLRARTVLVIDHRPSAAQQADRVCVLDQGCLVETGSHADLVARGGLYAQQFRAATAG